MADIVSGHSVDGTPVSALRIASEVRVVYKGAIVKMMWCYHTP